MSTTPEKTLEQRALELYTPPFKYVGGYIQDSQSRNVADNDGGEANPLRLRGWGRISYLLDADALQDEVGRLIAQKLTEAWRTGSGAPTAYKLVPAEPTAAMVDAMKSAWWKGASAHIMKTTDAYRVYFAMLAAAPQPPGGAQPDEADEVCVERGGDGVSCKTGCACEKASAKDEVDQRERFEQACYAHYLGRHAAGKTEDHMAPAGPRETLLWRDEQGNYGVLMFNASWWAWQEALKA